MNIIQCGGCIHHNPGGVILPESPCNLCHTSTTDGRPSQYLPARYTATANAIQTVSDTKLTKDQESDILSEVAHYLQQGVYDFTVYAGDVCVTCTESKETK